MPNLQDFNKFVKYSFKKSGNFGSNYIDFLVMVIKIHFGKVDRQITEIFSQRGLGAISSH